MKFDIVTIFPEMFESYFGESILKRAIKNKLIKITLHNLRDYSEDKHKKVDDRPFGGGPGMVMQIAPFYQCLKSLKRRRSSNKTVLQQDGLPQKTRTILLSAKGKRFNQDDAKRLANYKRLILLCGRYEGVDERVAENLADEEISIGDFVLTGGELGAMVLVDAVSRNIPGVLGDEASLTEESHGEIGTTEYPQYTRPEKFSPKKGTSWDIPDILKSGDHAKIKAWRDGQKRKS